ncbi:MAG: response regulator [Elusimicrobia bacterium]|nr:response regulator [Elusimicrobiota bacterium]
MDRPRILLAEDDASLATLMALDLKRRGYEVVSARNGREAAQKVAAQHYDAVVTDLRIGSPDGLEILRIAKQSQPETQVILITGHGSIDTAVTAMKNGAYDYMTKPIEPDELAIVIDKAIEHRRLLGEVRSPARARSSSPGPSTRSPPAAMGPSWPSTAEPCPRACSRASSSAT